jgi:MYXO-CTERM domain-containing protein
MRWLSAIGIVATLSSSVTARAQVFADFDDWTDVCLDFSGTECNVAFDTMPFMAVPNVNSGDQCYYGRCLHTRWYANGGTAWLAFEDSVSWSSVYFEARIRLPTEGSLTSPVSGDFVPLAKIEDEVAGLVYRVGLTGPDVLMVRRHHRSTPSDATSIRTGLPVTGAWTRVAVLISEVNTREARITMWVGDGDVATSEILSHRSDGTELPFTAFDVINALGELTAATTPKEVSIDDLCFADSVSARTGFCPTQAAGRPVLGSDAGARDAGVPDAGVITDAGADVGRPDAPVADTGGATRDSGDDETSFRGAGGCACSPAGRPSRAPAALLTALIAFAFTRRRR